MSGTPQAPQGNGNGHRNGGAGPHAGAEPHGHVNAHTDTDEYGNGAGGAAQYGGDPWAAQGAAPDPYGRQPEPDPYAPQAEHGQHVPRSWGGGEYDADATAFVQLPSGGFGELTEAAPLAAPGTGQGGYTPPPIDPSQHPADGTAPDPGADPAAGQHWVLPFAPGSEPGAPGPGPHDPGADARAAQYAAAPEPGHGTLGGPGPHPQEAPHPPAADGSAGLGQGAAAALAGSHEARTGRRPLGPGVAPAAAPDGNPEPAAPGYPDPGAPAPGPHAPAASASAAPEAPAPAWTPSSPTSAPHWDSAAPAAGHAPHPDVPAPPPAPEPGGADRPFPGAPDAPAYRFPSAPTADGPAGAPDAEPRHPGDPDVASPAPPEHPRQPGAQHGTGGQPAADPGIVAAEPPAPPAVPEHHADAEVTSLAEAAPAPLPAQRTAAQPAGTEPVETADAGAAAPAAEPAGGYPEPLGDPADGPAAAVPDGGPEPVHPSGDGTPEAAGDGTAPAAGEEAAPVPEAVRTEDEHPHVSYELRVNGVDRPVASAWIGESLLYVLRERLGLAGAKDGCSQGECGACSVQVDGRLVAACLVPAATAAGSEVRTVEGLSVDGAPSDVQCALAESGSVQCGFCVPGLAMTVHDLLEGNHAPTDLETRKAISGNLCRCSGYRGVVDAVRTVVERRAARAEYEHEAPEAHAAPGGQPHAPGPDPQGGYEAAGYGQQPGGHGPGPWAPGGYEPAGHQQDGPGPGGHPAPPGTDGYGGDGYGTDGYGGAPGYGPDPAAPGYPGPPEAPGTHGSGTWDEGGYGAHIPHQSRYPGNGGTS
ncbi:2Fe-2S iron-sulfur cluster-binding protein [Streptomyces sp. AA1529]|uniref:(2Fe-2S)-binding protein n=1 Tax=Streptomyces sp. AA1529 TaxID=1203257 RepID=UPI003EBBE6A1